MATETTTLDVPILERETTAPALTPRELIWRRFRKHRMAVVGMIGFVILMAFIIFGSILVS